MGLAWEVTLLKVGVLGDGVCQVLCFGGIRSGGSVCREGSEKLTDRAVDCHILKSSIRRSFDSSDCGIVKNRR